MAGEASDRELVVMRVFDAPRSLVLEAWTTREHLIHWWGPKGYTLPSCELDFRPGGSCRYCMRSPEARDLLGTRRVPRNRCACADRLDLVSRGSYGLGKADDDNFRGLGRKNPAHAASGAVQDRCRAPWCSARLD